MNLIIRPLVVLLLLCASSVTLATDVTLSWDPVTVDSKGVALPSGSSVSYNVYGAPQGQPLKLLANITTTKNVRSNVNPGTACYAISAVLASVEGAQTEVLCTTIDPTSPPPPITPGTPSGFTIQQTAPPTTFYYPRFRRTRRMYA